MRKNWQEFYKESLNAPKFDFYNFDYKSNLFRKLEFKKIYIPNF